MAIRATEAKASENIDMRSQACVFGRVDVHVQFDWVYMTQVMQDTNRNREAPIATDMYLGVTGDDIRCIELPYETAKMYIDATSRVDLSNIPLAFQKVNNSKNNNENGVITIESLRSC